jgi:hypothetical protein
MVSIGTIEKYLWDNREISYDTWSFVVLALTNPFAFWVQSPSLNLAFNFVSDEGDERRFLAHDRPARNVIVKRESRKVATFPFIPPYPLHPCQK